VLALLGAGGVLFVDFNRIVQEANATETEPPTFRSYLETVPQKLASLTVPTKAAGGGLELADMMPRAPEGWTARPLAEGEGGDIAGFLPRAKDEAEAESVDRIRSVGSTKAGAGAEVAILAYERGERRVVIQLIRRPDEIFTDPASHARRHALEVEAARLKGRPFLTVRGLDVTEEFPGEGIRARLFTATVGAQIEMRMLGSRRLDDADLVPFFETLNVSAMNAAVVNPEPGLGEVPVLVVASALGEADLAVLEADRAERSRAAIRRAGEVQEAARAALAATADPATTAAEDPQGPASACKTVAGVRRCSVATGG
jgi:hypothetical protein